MFWRWDAVNTVNLGEGDNALTIGVNSNTFQVRAVAMSHDTSVLRQRVGFVMSWVVTHEQHAAVSKLASLLQTAGS